MKDRFTPNGVCVCGPDADNTAMLDAVIKSSEGRRIIELLNVSGQSVENIRNALLSNDTKLAKKLLTDIFSTNDGLDALSGLAAKFGGEKQNE